MIRQTSIEVYRQIEAEGLLSKRRFEVYRSLFKFGPATQGEIVRKIGFSRQTSLTPRFAELEAMGVIMAVGERPCRETGRNVTEWDVTAKLPAAAKRPERRKIYASETLFGDLHQFSTTWFEGAIEFREVRR